MANKGLIEYLSSVITEKRFEQIQQVLQNRTRYLTVVLEDIYQPQNASAVLRTCDCFGIQDVHIIENINEYNINPDVVQGASKWLSLKYYNERDENTLAAIKKLKADGYRIVATTPHSDNVNLEEFDICAGKTALIFGTEVSGISDTVAEHADEFLKIPMFGFTESYNISVSAAIILHHLVFKLKESDINCYLSQEESEEILLNWLRITVKKSELVEKRYFKERK